ncbi:hypothetical protein SUGI_1060220 [Cryptomeria japonica]|nr:hypothetical protein SUGI_1060220 [Cryptomeria japonica]
MFGENAGVRILWVWAVGTLGVLCTVVVKRRMEDLEAIMNDNRRQTEMKSENNVKQVDREFEITENVQNNTET